MREQKISSGTFKHLINKNRQEQKQLATLICQKAGIPVDRPGSLDDLPAFEQFFKIRVAVVAASLGNKFIRVPDNAHKDWPILYLYLVDHEGLSHFHAITNITGFFFGSVLLRAVLQAIQYQHRASLREQVPDLQEPELPGN